MGTVLGSVIILVLGLVEDIFPEVMGKGRRNGWDLTLF